MLRIGFLKPLKILLRLLILKYHVFELPVCLLLYPPLRLFPLVFTLLLDFNITHYFH